MWAWAAPEVNCIQWKQGLSADVGLSHRFYWLSKPCVSSESLAEAVHKYLTGIKKNKKCSTEPKLKPDVEKADAWNLLSFQDRVETLANFIIYQVNCHAKEVM